MITIGGKPILWYIMKHYADCGFKNFVLLIGFKGKQVTEYFNNSKNIEPNWKIEYSDAGEKSNKGTRIKKAYNENKITGDKFLLSYGDDLCDVNINEVIREHEKNKKLVTLTSVKLVSDFGIIKLNGDNTVKEFREKPVIEDYWINGGYMVLDKSVVNYMKDGMEETDAFKILAEKGLVQVHKHNGFWKSMNTIKDMKILRDMWKSGELQKKLNLN